MGWVRNTAARFLMWLLKDHLQSLFVAERIANENFILESETRLNDACRLRHQHEGRDET